MMCSPIASDANDTMSLAFTRPLAANLTGRRWEIHMASHEVEARAIGRARFALFQKTRLAYRVPYGEWQEALQLAGFHIVGGAPHIRREAPIRELLEAYAPRMALATGEAFDRPRCAPWKGRRYRYSAMPRLRPNDLDSPLVGW